VKCDAQTACGLCKLSAAQTLPSIHNRVRVWGLGKQKDTPSMLSAGAVTATRSVVPSTRHPAVFRIRSDRGLFDIARELIASYRAGRHQAPRGRDHQGVLRASPAGMGSEPGMLPSLLITCALMFFGAYAAGMLPSLIPVRLRNPGVIQMVSTWHEARECHVPLG
jgi:hypothetical protein